MQHHKTGEHHRVPVTKNHVINAMKKHLKVSYHVPDWRGHLCELTAPVGCYWRNIHTPVQWVQPLGVNCIDVHPDVVLKIVTRKYVQKTTLNHTLTSLSHNFTYIKKLHEAIPALVKKWIQQHSYTIHKRQIFLNKICIFLWRFHDYL